MKLIFELSAEGREGASLPELDVPEQDLGIPETELRSEIPLPEVSEVDVVRHYTALSRMNFGVDSGFYPLGSCTMKYNPKVNEVIAGLPGFKSAHPYQPEELSQGCLQVIYELSRDLAEITGMDAFTLQPAAGAQGELTGLMMAKAYFKRRGENRKKVLVPDSAHGTNPASAALCGYEVVEIPSDPRGGVDMVELKGKATEDVAALMLTNPNTLGLFEENILEISDIVHGNGGLMYCDGANMNAILGIAKPGDMGFDIVHLNLHKTFSAPHGGGGPGSGPVGVKERLARFLPKPVVQKNGGRYFLDYDRPESIGRVKAFYGNFSVLVKAYAYIRALGPEGLKEVAENAVLNANYVMRKLEGAYELPYDRVCKHEFVLSGKRQLDFGVHAMDIAKRLIDYGFHPPTVYFPLIVKEAIMIEPTETEGKETLDSFVEAMLKIAEEAEKEPELLRNAPKTTPTTRLDALTAARKPNLRWKER
ncbi:MAG: aminomethyl-transferring glycine dehydrogenase subunit GcvPB [Candidatus Brockarchaeota archaeon]|nr:aminomethyl-transferring glycine dehydrogenase subunit GcvPB [Candidatus Brockarchaeota archaeon]